MDDDSILKAIFCIPEKANRRELKGSDRDEKIRAKRLRAALDKLKMR